MIELENFPTNKIAQKMMKTVSPIYDKAYVAKWLYQVMGVEMEEAWQFFEELRLQAFPETATWGIVYWEQRYHIASDESLTIEERRRRVIIKRSKRKPMNPERMKQLVQDVSGRSAEVTERNDEYVFFVSIFPGESNVDYQALIDAVRIAKPSHLSPVLLFETDVKLTITREQQIWSYDYPAAGTGVTGETPDINTVGALHNAGFVIDASMEGNKFDYPAAGTKPDTNTVGAIRRESLNLDVDMKDYPYEYAISGTGRTGEAPDTNTVGALSRNTLALCPKVDGHKYDYPITGTKPDTNTVGALSRNTLMLDTEMDSHKYDYPAAGTGVTGETPDINTVGALHNAGFVIDASMEGNKFDYPAAGTKNSGEVPDTNVAGKVEGGSVLPSVSADGSVFEYQLCGEAEHDI